MRVATLSFLLLACGDPHGDDLFSGLGSGGSVSDAGVPGGGRQGGSAGDASEGGSGPGNELPNHATPPDCQGEPWGDQCVARYGDDEVCGLRDARDNLCFPNDLDNPLCSERWGGMSKFGDFDIPITPPGMYPRPNDIVHTEEDLPRTPAMERCPACGAGTHLLAFAGGFGVECGSLRCGVRGPRGANRLSAVNNWNAMAMPPVRPRHHVVVKVR